MNFKHFVIPLLLLFVFSACTDENFADEFTQQERPELYQTKRSCGHEKHMENLLSDPDYKSKHEAKFSSLEIELSRAEIRNCSSPVIIPVAIHFQNVTGTNAACLAQLVESQISALNKDISGTNTDVNKWTSQASSFFPGISNGETCVKFCVATKNHPGGFGLSNGQQAITVNKTNGDRANEWSGYLNIFVRPDLGFLGEAPLGGAGDGDGVLIDASTFGLGAGCGNVRPQSPYNLGRTTTHEVGHYFFLDHIWGNGCGVDDDVSDTPDQAGDSGGCPNLGVKSCGSNDMHMNYMDYTDDSCMYMFSAGQSQRMQAYINGNLTNMINKAASVCDESNSGNSGNEDVSDNDTNQTDPDDTDSNDNDGNDGDDGTQCSVISLSTVQVLSSTQVKIDWADVPNADLYRIRYKTQSEAVWTIKNLWTSDHTISPVSANASYVYQMRARCASGWTAFSAEETFTTGDSDNGDTDNNSGDCNENEIIFELVLDAYGSETSWELVKETGATVITGGPYTDGQEGSKVNNTFCLADGCYTMYIDDAFGDGFCCEYGNGAAVIKNANGKVIAESSGNFGSYMYLDFCINNGLSRFVGERKDESKKSLGRKNKSN